MTIPRLLGTTLGILVLFLAACLPQRVSWSPDGSQALIIAGDGLRTCDPDGKFSDVINKDVAQALWLPDGKHLLVSIKEDAKTWDEARRGLTDDEAQEVITNGNLLHDEALKYTGDWNKFKDAMDPKIKWPLLGDGWTLAGMYVRDKNAVGLPEKVGDTWKIILAFHVELHAIYTAEIANGTLQLGPMLYRTARNVADMRPSPDGSHILLSFASFDGDSMERSLAALWVLDAAGTQPPLHVTSGASWYADWSPDGHTIVYARSAAAKMEKDAVVGGWLAGRHVLSQDGQWITDAPEDLLARVAFDQFIFVRCVAPGRVLFTAPEMQLPADKDDKVGRNLFVWTDVDHRQVKPLIIREAHAEMIDPVFFSPSPDGKQIALADLGDHVLLLDAANGDLKTIQKENINDKSRLAPVWRNNDELCLLMPSEKAGHLAEVTLYSVSKSTKHALSGDWPEPASRGFITEAPQIPPNQPAN